MTYSEKLKDPRWQRKRLEILERDEFACTTCGDTKSTLHVHHFYYDKGKEPWDYLNEVLSSHCEKCHAIIEWLKKQMDELTVCNVFPSFDAADDGKIKFYYLFCTYGKKILLLLIEYFNDKDIQLVKIIEESIIVRYYELLTRINGVKTNG